MKQPNERSMIRLPGFIIYGTNWFFEEDPSLKWRTVPYFSNKGIVMYSMVLIGTAF